MQSKIANAIQASCEGKNEISEKMAHDWENNTKANLKLDTHLNKFIKMMTELVYICSAALAASDLQNVDFH